MLPYVAHKSKYKKKYLLFVLLFLTILTKTEIIVSLRVNERRRKEKKIPFSSIGK